MFDLTINPVLIPLHFLGEGMGVRYYGLVYALGFLFAYWYLRQRVKQGRLNLKIDEVDTFMIYAIIGGIVGGRVGEFLFFQTQTLLSNPLQIFMIWQGGMSIHGGMLGFALATWLFCRKHDIRFYEITDHIVIPAALALFFGRIANFTNAELCGRPTNVAWAVNLNTPPKCDGYRHPSQLYEALKNLFIFGFLLINEQHQRLRNKYQAGYATWLFLLLYGILRVITNIWRDDTYLVWFFSTGQFLSLFMIAGALFILFKYYWLRPAEHKKKAIKKNKTKKKK